MMRAEDDVKIILPKERYEWRRQDGPLFFLAGPIRGGGDWQAACCQLFAQYGRDLCLAVPCRWDKTHPLADHFVTGLDRFDRQLDWERHHLEQASRDGCILFWLPLESETEPHPGPEPYAMDTRGELGEWRGRMMHDRSGHIRLVIGANPKFLGLSQIQRNFNAALQRHVTRPFTIHSTLPATVKAAIARSC